MSAYCAPPRTHRDLLPDESGIYDLVLSASAAVFFVILRVSKLNIRVIITAYSVHYQPSADVL